MTVAYTRVRTVEHLRIEPDTDFRLECNSGSSRIYTVQVREIELVDSPTGARWVSVRGPRVRTDGRLSLHSRGGLWQVGGSPWPSVHGDLPAELAAVVEDARPGWWAGEPR